MSLPYFHFYGRDFRDGVRGMSGDEIAIYVLVLTLIYDAEAGGIEDDERSIAAKIGFGVRVWRRVRTKLLELGKLDLADGRLSNARAEAVIAERERLSQVRAESGKRGGKASGKARQKPSFGEVSAKFPESLAETSANLSQKPERKPGNIKPDPEALASKAEGIRHKERSSAPSGAEQPALRMPRPLDRCLAAAGPGLADPAKEPGLHLSAPRIAAAIAGGCDLELDMVPVIAARTAKARASPIRNWTFFEGAWADARDARLAGFAPADPTRFNGETDASRTAPANRRRNTGSMVDAAVRLIHRTGPVDGHGGRDEPAEGEVIAPRRIGAC